MLWLEMKCSTRRPESRWTGVDESLVHRVLEHAAVLAHHGAALEFDQGLLDVGVDVAEHIGQQVGALIRAFVVAGARR